MSAAIDQENDSSTAAPKPKRRRVATAHRFVCNYPDCGKTYSRAEHLNRHNLNHNPTEIFVCDISACGQRFVRKDLLERHQERHAAGAVVSSARLERVGRSSSQSGNGSRDGHSLEPAWPHSPIEMVRTDRYSPPRPQMPAPQVSGMRSSTMGNSYGSNYELENTMAHGMINAEASLMTPASLEPQDNSMQSHSMHNGVHWGNATHYDNTVLVDAFGLNNMDMNMAFETLQDDRQPFGSWLFNDAGSGADLDMTSVPFLNLSSEHIFENNFNPASDVDSPAARSYSLDLLNDSSLDFGNSELVSPSRRQAFVHLVKLFKGKHRHPLSAKLEIFLSTSPTEDIPLLTHDLLNSCIAAYWTHISPQMPFIHRPTFSPNTSNLLLFAVMVMLGSSTLNRLSTKGLVDEYAAFADLLAEHLRWEIFTDPAASPPAELWVQQALLLLELYEKMFSTRELHERAHIHHASTLTLLRRGNPLVGQLGTETPMEGTISRGEEDSAMILSARTGPSWWLRWAQAEAQNRVVFAAYLLDCSHSTFFGHAICLSPHEIMLPLPCDDQLWTAPTAEALQRVDQNLRSYGLKPVSFLSALRRILHGHTVRTHPWARKILMYGLITVGWHINHRESMLTCFDTPRTSLDQERCRKLLVEAFDAWKDDFDDTLAAETLTGLPNSNLKIKRNFDDPQIIYFVANLSLHANIVDFQMLAGSTRLLGRRVSNRDKAHAVARVKDWSKTESGRHAVLHAFKFLHAMLVVPQAGLFDNNSSSDSGRGEPTITYNCRQDELNYRPWIIFLAALTIWSFTVALNPSARLEWPGSDGDDTKHKDIAGYLTLYGTRTAAADLAHLKLDVGLVELLDMLHVGYEDAENDLLIEAHIRFRECRDMLRVK